MTPDCPVRGIVSPLSAGLLLMLSSVSPCAICHLIVPLSRSIAVMRPYGGLISGSPCTVIPAPPPSPPAAAAGAADADAASAPAPAPAPPVLRTPAVADPWTKFMSDTLTSGGGTSPSGLTL